MTITSERLATLERRYLSMMTREIKAIAGLQVEGAISADDADKALEEIAEIGACIKTAARALGLNELL